MKVQTLLWMMTYCSCIVQERFCLPLVAVSTNRKKQQRKKNVAVMYTVDHNTRLYNKITIITDSELARRSRNSRLRSTSTTTTNKHAHTHTCIHISMRCVLIPRDTRELTRYTIRMDEVIPSDIPY
eukprot:GHVQ01036703.1.p1 GENE.GHVQ01036703.1~~GHVQ01036703.1.p1  ORF type:complete len:126 (+),score=19.41 GHVQ01036703.1:419-796(+)